MEENYDCVICFELAEEPFLSSCCDNLFCKSCIGKLRNCPMCQKEGLKGKEAGKFVKRIIGNMAKKCPDCNQTTTVSEFKTHIMKCPKKKISCPDPNCSKSMNKKDLLKHIMGDHAH